MKHWMAALLALATGTVAAGIPGVTMPQNFEVAFNSYQLPSFADAIAIGDLTGDGLDDVVVATADRGRDETPDRAVYLFVQQADGLLQVPWRYEYTARANHLGLGLADLNGDGRLDIALSHSQGLTLMLNTGNAGDRFVIKPLPGLPERALTIADIDLDGRPDLVTPGFDNTIHVHYGDGAGGIRATAPLAIASGASFVRVADMNRDRLPDLVASYAPGNEIAVWHRKRDGSYSQPVHVGFYAESFAIGDFNHDGLPDVSAHYDSGDYPAIYFQEAAGFGYRGPVRVPGYSRRGPRAAADLNGDGRDDVMHLAWAFGGLYSNLQGDTGMEPQRLDPVPMDSDLSLANALAIGDLNHDGCPDAAAAIDNYGLVWLYGNTCPARSDLAVTTAFDTSAVTVQLANVSRGLTPVATPTAEIDLQAIAPATLQLGALPTGCRVLAQAPDHARVLCGVASLAFGEQAQLSLPLQFASTAPSSAAMAVTARTRTLELSLANNRTGKRIAVPATPPVAAAVPVAVRKTDLAPARKRVNRTEPRR
jgi:hypothetical protein